MVWTTPAELIQAIKRDLKIAWVKDGREWDGGKGALLWSGEGANIDTPLYGRVPAFDYWAEGELYEFGVHKVLRDWSEKNGLYWECYDPGTYLAYRA